MTGKKRILRRILSLILCMALIMPHLPWSAISSIAASPSVKMTNKVTDTPTVDTWQGMFTDNSTRTAGAVWTDKSVFGTAQSFLDATSEGESYELSMIDENNNFLVALSALASSKQITGYSTAPTDTVFVLDMSSSMRSSSYNNIEPLAEATNSAIQKLMKLNYNNRVAVVLYSGAEGQGNNGGLKTRVLLPLDRYTTSDANGDFIKYEEINRREYISVASGVRNSAGERDFGLENDRSTWSSGTFTQDGIHVATDILLDSDKVITEAGNVQEGQERMPIMVLMTDGEPSVFSTDYAVGTDDPADGLNHLESRYKTSTTSTGTATEFMVQLTAAYSKYRIEQEYKENNLLFYSLGLLGNTRFSTTILDPESHTSTDRYWSLYLDDSQYESLRLTNNTVSNFSITTDPDIREPFVAKVLSDAAEDLRVNDRNKYRYYIDEYFQADSGTDLNAAFDAIVDEIILQSTYYPTLVEENNINYGGYLSMVDTLGKYMEIKDMKGIQLGGAPFLGRNAARELAQMSSTENLNEIQKNLLEAVSIELGVDKNVAFDVIRAAQNSGVLYFDSNTDFSNAIGWYGNYESAYASAEYIAPWNGNGDDNIPEGANCTIKSYYFYGAGETSEGNVRVGDMRFIDVDEITFLTGEQKGQTKLRVRIPASLIPLVIYNIGLNGETLDSDVQSFEMSGAETPIRLIYEVGLKDEINSFNVGTLAADAYNSESGKYEFYSNKWDYIEPDKIGVTPPRTVGNSYSYFDPSTENEYMYFQYDEELYTLSGSSYELYTGDAAPQNTGAAYYAARYVYENPNKQGGSNKAQLVYYQVDASDLAAAERGAGDNASAWYIPKGTPTLLNDAKQINYKDGENAQTADGGPTATYKTSTTYYIRNEGVGGSKVYNMEVAMGNNGKLSMDALQGIRLQKIVPDNSGLNADTEYTFTISPAAGNDAVLSDDYDLYLVEGIDNDGTAGAEANGKVTPVNNSLTVTLKANQTLYIAGLPAGEYTVTEAKSADYVVSAVNGTATTENSTTLVVVDRVFTTTSFTNIARTTGNLTIGKEVVHPFGVNYQIPEDKNSFNMTVTLTLNDEPLANKTYKALQTKVSNVTEIKTDENGQFNITLSHDDQLEIFDLPKGTIAAVVENTVLNGFTANYWDNGAEGGDGVVTVETGRTASVLIVNNYQPNQVSPNLIVQGTKNLTGDAYTGTFTFKLQRAVNNNGVWEWQDKGTEQVVSYAAVNGQKEFSFGTVLNGEVYTEIGDYYYRVTEIVGTDSNIIYDTNVHSFTVHVTDTDMDGNLEISATNGITTTRPGVVTISGNTVTANFTNTHTNTATATVTVDVVKNINNPSGSEAGNKLAGFDFELSDENMGLQLETNERGALRFTLNYTAEDLEEEKEKTFTYNLKELLPEDYVNGSGAWVYDTKQVTVTVKLTLNDDNTLTAVVTDDGTNNDNADNAITVGFTNTYTPVIAALDLDVTKTLTGKDLAAGEFTFEVIPYNANSPLLDKDGSTLAVNKLTATNAEAKSGVKADVAFPTMYFNKVGTFFYNVSEVTGNKSGVTYDQSIYFVTVTVVDNNGQLEATYAVLDAVGNEIPFVNNYTPDPISSAINGNKTLTGRDIRNEEFTFVLTESDENGNPVTGGKSWTAKNNITGKNNGTFAFPAIEYNAAGTYYYTVTEQTGAAGNGVTYSNEKYVVTVTVSYSNETGEFTAATAIEKISEQGKTAADAVSFTNHYKAANTAFDIVGNKTLTGNLILQEGDFTFELYETESDYDYSGDPRTVKNDKDGKFVFENIALTEARPYYFVVKENIPDDKVKGITYDEYLYYISVNVTDNGNGRLTYTDPVITHVISQEEKLPAVAIAFYNSYDAEDASVTIHGEKELTGRELLDDEFTFVLYEADKNFEIKEGTDSLIAKNKADKTFAFDALTFSEAGIYYYVVVEDDSNPLDRVTYDATEYHVTIEVTDDLEGNLVASAPLIEKKGLEGAVPMIFRNSYKPLPTDLVIDFVYKNLTGRDAEDEEFQFVLTDMEDQVLLTGKNTLDEVTDKGYKVVFDDKLTFTEADTYQYKIKEVVANEDGTEGIFYDRKVYTLEVTVVNENNQGQLKAAYEITGGDSAETVIFNNSYVADDATAAIEGVKNLDGKKLVEGAFTFVLQETDDQWNPLDGAAPETTTNREGGAFRFDLSYDEVKTHYYVLTERETITDVDADPDRVDYDDTKYLVTVEVTDDLKGKLEAETTITKVGSTDPAEVVFNNNYTPTPAELVIDFVNKKLSGRDLRDGEFTFAIKDKEGIVVLEGKNDVNENVIFDNKNIPATITDPLTFDQTGDFEFVIVETSKDDPDKGITADQTIYTLKVKVVNDNGVLKATYQIGEGTDTTVTFQNQYKAADAKVTITGTKELENRDLMGDEFAFLLQEANEDFTVKTGGDSKQAVNAADKSFTFEELTFGEVGTYYYVVTEDDTVDAERITFDDSVYGVTIVVTDDGNGKLKADTTIEKQGQNVDEITFKNIFTPKPEDIFVDIIVNKTVLDWSIAQVGHGTDGFLFQLENVKTKDKLTQLSGQDGKALFSLPFTEKDINQTYEYKLTEVPGDDIYMIYSEASYTIKVKITLNENNKLAATVTMDGKTTDNAVAAFENIYAPDGFLPEGGAPTGDNTNAGLWMALMMMSSGLAAILCFFRKRRREI